MKFNKTDGEAVWADYRAKNKDFYGKGVIDFAERWANLMEPRLEAGEDLVSIADATCDEADTEGITGFMYGAAVQTLAHTWAWGEQLRLWHNHQYDPDDKSGANKTPGATINPAIIHIA